LRHFSPFSAQFGTRSSQHNVLNDRQDIDIIRLKDRFRICTILAHRMAGQRELTAMTRDNNVIELNSARDRLRNRPSRNRDDKRMHARLDSDDRLFVQVVLSAADPDLVGTTVSCTAINLSVGGIRFRTDSAIPTGALLDLWVDPQSSGKFFLAGEVRSLCQRSRRQRRDGWIIGVGKSGQPPTSSTGVAPRAASAPEATRDEAGLRRRLRFRKPVGTVIRSREPLPASRRVCTGSCNGAHRCRRRNWCRSSKVVPLKPSAITGAGTAPCRLFCTPVARQRSQPAIC
jgi:hypothetical protein